MTAFVTAPFTPALRTHGDQFARRFAKQSKSETASSTHQCSSAASLRCAAKKERGTGVSRREALKLSVAASAALATFVLPSTAKTSKLGDTDTPNAWFVPRSASAAATALGEEIAEAVYGCSFSGPGAGWTKQTAMLSSARSAVIFTRDGGEGEDSNINFVSTPVPGDFMKLTSFGSLENVLTTLVPRGKGDVDGEVISTETDSKKNAYVIEYTVTSKGVKRHLITVFSLQPGRYLLTLTGQSREETWPQVEATVREVVDSYQLKKLD